MNDDIIFFILVAIMLVPTVPLAIRMTIAQHTFINVLERKKNDKSVPKMSQFQSNKNYIFESIWYSRWFRAATKLRYEDPELDRAAERVRNTTFVVRVTMIVTSVIVALIILTIG